MTHVGKTLSQTVACALAVLFCAAAWAAGPAPATNPAGSTPPSSILPATNVPTSNPSASSAAIVQSAIEREPIRRGAELQNVPTTAAAASDARSPANPGAAVDLKRVALSLTLVLGVIFAARFAMKKLFPAVSVGRNSQIIRVVSRSVIGPKQQFLLVKLGKRLVLVGDSGASMNPLAEITDPDEVAELVGQLQSEANHSSVGAFASMFRKAESQFQPEDDKALASVATATASQAARRELLIGESDDESSNEPAVATIEPPPDRKLVAAASEINGLMDRVRLLSNRLRGS
ncbi:hypothetical protein BH09PLA1_BH09PLA1_28760 [soil metagenome]